MTNKNLKIILLFFCVCFVIPNAFSQWRYPNAENIKDDIIITYEVTYDNELSEKQKQSTRFIKEFVVIFNNEKLLEKRFTNNIKLETSLLLDYNKELGYSCVKQGEVKQAVVSKFKQPFKKVTLLEGEEEQIIGFSCQVHTAKIKGKLRKIYTTKNLGLRFVKQFNAEGFLLKYSANDKYLGVYTVTAKTIFYTKVPDSTYDLKGFQIKTSEEQKEYSNEMASKREKNKEKSIENLGEQAPSFIVRSTRGKKFKSKDLLGKVVVLNFWFTTCGPCKKEIPQLNELKKRYNGKDVEFIAIALDQEYKIDKFVKQNPFTYNIIEDGRWLASKFDISLYPTNIIIDKEGNYQFFKTGYKKDITEAMSFKIDMLLEIN